MLIPNRRKKLALRNIRGNITKDAKTAEEISKAAAVRFGTIGMSVFRFPLLNKKNISDYVVIQGKENLMRFLLQGKAVLLRGIIAATGNWKGRRLLFTGILYLQWG